MITADTTTTTLMMTTPVTTTDRLGPARFPTHRKEL